MGKSALRQVVSMVIQLKRADDVATEGCRCNGGNLKRGSLRYTRQIMSASIFAHSPHSDLSAGSASAQSAKFTRFCPGNASYDKTLTSCHSATPLFDAVVLQHA
jgi:hypothetical protein